MTSSVIQASTSGFAPTDHTSDALRLQDCTPALADELPPSLLATPWTRCGVVSSCPGRCPGHVCVSVSLTGLPTCPIGHSLVPAVRHCRPHA